MCCSEKLESELCFSSIITVVAERLEEKRTDISENVDNKDKKTRNLIAFLLQQLVSGEKRLLGRQDAVQEAEAQERKQRKGVFNCNEATSVCFVGAAGANERW